MLTPTAYYASAGRATRNPIPANPYLWADEAVKHILENRQYTGCAVNFKSTTVSFKVHKKIYNPVEEQQIIPNMQEPIISEELFDRVQEIRQNPQQFKFSA
ncbi:MAG: recombinase family protein [Oscillospiraceae bacterium]